MSLNEAKGYRVSGLTREQQEEAEAEIYGRRYRKETPQMPPQPLSAEEYARMRELLAAHDAQNKTGYQEFDLNNPPTPPYVYREYPKLMYDHKNRCYLQVEDAQGMEAALAKGWKKEPWLDQVAEPEPLLDAESQDGADAAQEKINEARHAKREKVGR